MESIESFLVYVKDLLWGPPLLALLMGTGIYLTILLRGMQIRYLGYAFKQVFAQQKKESQGDINSFEALMTSLAGAIGTGTIVGVATAITVGGLGAMFWMWVCALVGMATKYSESMLAVKYRDVDHRGEMIGGPMQYMAKGLGWRGVAVLFAIFGSVASLGTGNLVQVNSISEAVQNVWDVNPWVTGVVVSLLVVLIIIGGVQSIGRVSGVLVPFMALFYIGGGLVILAMHIDKVPEAFYLIVKSAFTGQAAAGGFAGASIMAAIQMGMARSVFSSESGLGISSMAAAAAKTDSPGRQGMVIMTGALVSTVIVCSITGLVLAVTNVLGQTNANGEPLRGASMAIYSFSSTLYAGEYIVSFGLILFAFTTVIAWAYYGEKCFEYLFGEKYIILYRFLYSLIVIPGAALKMDFVWNIADITNALMVIPNLLALIALSKVIVSETNTFLKKVKEEEEQEAKELARSSQ